MFSHKTLRCSTAAPKGYREVLSLVVQVQARQGLNVETLDFGTRCPRLAHRGLSFDIEVGTQPL
jgi:hypothetical protein